VIVLQQCEMPPLLARIGLPRIVLAATEREIASEESGDVEKNEAYWMWLAGTLAALSSLGAFVYTLGENGMPISFWPIVLESALFVVFLTGFTVSLDRVRAALGRQPWLRNANSVLLLTLIPFALAVGVFAGHASSQAKPAAIVSSAYAKQLRKEMVKLREMTGAVSLSAASTPALYAREARELGRVYGRVRTGLSGLHVDARDQTAHRGLVRALATLSAAYRHLAKVVGRRSSSVREVKFARGQVQEAMKGVRSAEQALKDLGYRLELTV
jgi:hypothetical protein